MFPVFDSVSPSGPGSESPILTHFASILTNMEPVVETTYQNIETSTSQQSTSSAFLSTPSMSSSDTSAQEFSDSGSDESCDDSRNLFSLLRRDMKHSDGNFNLVGDHATLTETTREILSGRSSFEDIFGCAKHCTSIGGETIDGSVINTRTGVITNLKGSEKRIKESSRNGIFF